MSLNLTFLCHSHMALGAQLRPSGPSIPKGPGDRWKIPTNYEAQEKLRSISTAGFSMAGEAAHWHGFLWQRVRGGGFVA